MKILYILLILFVGFTADAQVYQDSLGVQYFKSVESDTTYVMRQYFMCFLLKGEKRDYDEATTSEIQKGHLGHLDSLAQADLISMAGPFGNDGDKRGIVIYNTATLEEAQMLAEKDPAVKAGSLMVEIIPWWGAVGAKLR